MAKKQEPQQFKVEHGIPVAPIQRKSSHVYPFAKMKSGDSFLVPEGTFKNSSSARQSVHLAAKRAGVRINARVVEGGLRVWLRGKR